MARAMGVSPAEGQGYRIWIIAVFGMTAANTAWRGVKRRSGDAAMTEFANRFDALLDIPIRECGHIAVLC